MTASMTRSQVANSARSVVPWIEPSSRDAGGLAHPARRREALDGGPHRGETLVDALLVEVAHDDRDAEPLREQHRDLRGHESGADDADAGDGLRERPVGGADGLLAAGDEPERVHRLARISSLMIRSASASSSAAKASSRRRVRAAATQVERAVRRRPRAG